MGGTPFSPEGQGSAVSRGISFRTISLLVITRHASLLTKYLKHRTAKLRTRGCSCSSSRTRFEKTPIRSIALLLGFAFSRFLVMRAATPTTCTAS